jgi:hypothetical protein
MDGQERGAPGADMWGQLVIDTLVRPRGAARQVMDAGVPPMYLLQGAVLVTCLAMVLNFVALKLISVAVDPLTAAMLSSPIIGVVEQLLFLFVTVVLTVRIGRLFGGKGGFWAGLALLVWLNMVAVLVMVAQVVVLLLVPSVDALVGVVAFAPLLWLVWVYANFVAELHGFQNPFFVLGAMILTAMVLFFALATLLTMLGFAPQEMS